MPPVTLTVTRNGAPVSGVLVYFQNVNNSLVKKVETDAAGKASAVMIAGGFVTAIDPFPPEPPPGVAVVVGNNDLRTFGGVKPGDELVLTRFDAFTSVRLTIPTDPLASSYDIGTSCGTGSISTGGGSASAAAAVSDDIQLRNCGTAMDILVVARDGIGAPRSALYHPNVTVAPAIDLSADTFGPLVNANFGFSYAPDVGGFSFTHTFASARGGLGIPFEGSIVLAGGSGSTTIRVPTVAGAVSVVDSSLYTGTRQHVVDWKASAAAYALDLTDAMLPNMADDVGYAYVPKEISWTQDSDGTMPDLTIAAINVSLSTERTWHWTIAAPHRPGQITFPILPNDVAEWAPVAGDVVGVERVMNVKVPGGYDAIRRRVLDVREAFDETGTLGAFVSGPTGRAVISWPESSELRRAR